MLFIIQISLEVDVGMMGKTPPNRRGITFEVGATLEARDTLKNWYPANIEKVDYDDEKILIHYRQWSHRYDEWFDWTSPYLRPVERIQLRRQGLQDDYPIPRGGGKTRSSERNGVRKPQNGRDRRPQENVPKSKRARHSISDQEGDGETEDDNDVDEDEWDDREGKEKPKRKDGEGDVTKESPPTIKQQEEDTEQHAGQNNLKDHMTATVGPNGVKVEEDQVQSEERSTQHLNGGIKKEEVEMKTEDTVLSSSNEPKPSTESPNQMSTQTGPVSIPLPSALSTNDRVEQKAASQPDSSKSAPLGLPVKLYRVIKNQPPPVLSINLDHNPFKCSAVGCTKSFRKAKLLHYHMKYYHGEDQQLEDNLSPTRSVQTQASEKHPSPTTLESPKRRRTISASMRTYSTVHSPTRTPPSPRSEAKTMSRRTSVPPAVSTEPTQSQQQREKSKENQLDRNGPRPVVTETFLSSSMDIGLVKERDRLKDKKRTDFLRIKLKKKKKKKKAKSGKKGTLVTLLFCMVLLSWSSAAEYTGSEENIDISIFALQSKLNLPLKFPLSDNHKPESYHCRPGYNQSKQKNVDGGCGWSDDELGVELDVTTPPLNLGSVALETGVQEIVRCVCEVEEENDFMIQCEDCLCWQHGTCMGLLEEIIPDKYTCYICRDSPGDVQRVVEVLNGLQLKMSILHTQTHPDLRLWCQPWKQAERPWRRGGTGTGTDAAPSPAPTDEGSERDHKSLARGGAEALMSAAMEKLSRASSSSFSPYQSFQDSYIMSEHCYQKPRAYYPAVEQRLVGSDVGRWGQAEVKMEGVACGVGGDGDCSSQQHQWQINLLDHIDAVQEEVTNRMDFIERELDALESWLDYTGELEPPEPLARLPQLKHRMKLLLTELAKVQQIALCCST
ncbi:unnamed protein product [Coregonus sp. 'balchen']|nr:unnamed protein product [Coregonus sp. 'balchen']